MVFPLGLLGRRVRGLARLCAYISRVIHVLMTARDVLYWFCTRTGLEEELGWITVRRGTWVEPWESVTEEHIFLAKGITRLLTRRLSENVSAYTRSCSVLDPL